MLLRYSHGHLLGSGNTTQSVKRGIEIEMRRQGMASMTKSDVLLKIISPDCRGFLGCGFWVTDLANDGDVGAWSSWRPFDCRSIRQDGEFRAFGLDYQSFASGSESDAALRIFDYSTIASDSSGLTTCTARKRTDLLRINRYTYQNRRKHTWFARPGSLMLRFDFKICFPT